MDAIWAMSTFFWHPHGRLCLRRDAGRISEPFRRAFHRCTRRQRRHHDMHHISDGLSAVCLVAPKYRIGARLSLWTDEQSVGEVCHACSIQTPCPCQRLPALSTVGKSAACHAKIERAKVLLPLLKNDRGLRTCYLDLFAGFSVTTPLLSARPTSNMAATR
jgi:hypothetical protein